MSINGFVCGGCGAAYADLGDFWAHLSAAHRIPVQSSPTPSKNAPAPVQRATVAPERPKAITPGHGAVMVAQQAEGTLPPCKRCQSTRENRRPGYGARFRSLDGLCANCNAIRQQRRAS